MITRPLNVGFISFRFAGTDGVSLETAKWAEILQEMGHSCYYFSYSVLRNKLQLLLDNAFGTNNY